MDVAVLLITMFFCFFIGVPIAYSLALAAIAGALWIGIPLEAVMLKISDGVSKVAMLTIPFFVLAGAIMGEGGRGRRLGGFAARLGGFTRGRGGAISISALFMAVVLPGLLLGFSLIILCLVFAYRDGHPRGQTVAAKDALRITMDAAWRLVALFLILGGILGGIFTAIEAGAVACIWAFFVTMFIYRDYRWRDLPVLLHRTLRTVAMVLTLIACASSVGYVMALTQMPAKMTAFFLSISDNKYVILLLINILLLILGTLVDMAPSILIATPILLPVMQNFGVDPVHFGMIMLLNLGIGLCHPPVGSILFVGCAVGKVTIEQVMRKIWPFYAVMFLVLMCVTYIPEVSLWLPRHVLR